MTKPDDRSDNVEKLQKTVQNTIENLEEAEEYLTEHAEELAPEEIQAISAKNMRRRESIRGLREEIKDEVRARRARNEDQP